MKPLIGVALTVASMAASAYEFEFVGRVTYTNGSLNDVSTGTLIHGHFIGENPTDTFASMPGDVLANYRFATGQVTATIGPNSIVAARPTVRLVDNGAANIEDGFSMTSGYPISINGGVFEQGDFGFNLTTKPGNTSVINGLGLPSEIEVADFDSPSSLTYGYLQWNGGQTGRLLKFEVLSVTVTSVPEPSALAMSALGLIGLATVTRRSRSPS